VFFGGRGAFPPSTSTNGTLESTRSTNQVVRTFIIQFFRTAEADASGYGEGAIFLGQTQVTTNTQGQASFGFPAGSVPPGEFVTAMATNKATGDTSEFSQVEVVTELVIGGPP
jgi:hypothetical protein